MKHHLTVNKSRAIQDVLKSGCLGREVLQVSQVQLGLPNIECIHHLETPQGTPTIFFNKNAGFQQKCLFQLDDGSNLYIGNGWKSPNIHPCLTGWPWG